MESNAPLHGPDDVDPHELGVLGPGPDDPRTLLAVADQSRQRLVDDLHLPAGLHPMLAGAFGSVWWVVAIAAVLGGTGYALGTRQWWRSYLRDPAEYARGASPRLLAALALAAGVGFAVLVVVGR